jgi:hypothetical protein
MVETAYETLPELESTETRMGASTVVMKFGGISVADPGSTTVLLLACL